MKKYKSDFRIEKIGTVRFYSGIVVGIVWSVILYLLFQTFLKAKTITPAMLDENWNESLSFDFYTLIFFAFMALSLGFCYTSYLWMSGTEKLRGINKRRIQYAQSNSIFIFYVVLLVALRFFTIYISFNYGGFNLGLQYEYGYFILIFPLFIFLYNWIWISRIYQSKKPLLISIVIFVLCGLIMTAIRT